MESERRKFGMVLAFAVLFATLAFVSLGCASADTIYVPDNFTKIQWAVDNATAGDTIIVKSGTYYENVNVIKQLILRGIDTGTGKPVVDASGNGNAITLSADGITVEGFNATNSRRSGIYLFCCNNTLTGNTANNNGYGIYLYSSSNNILTGNDASNNGDGIYLCHSSNNTITGNITNNNRYGIWLYGSNNNAIKGNAASNNRYGIYLDNSNNNAITGNTASNNSDEGIRLYGYSNNNTIRGNTANNNHGEGIRLCVYSNNNTITGNAASNNHEEGIILISSCNNTITGNIASNNRYGILLFSSCNNTISDNAASNDSCGIRLHYSCNNILKGNNASNNNVYGICLCISSYSNKIYLNDFINNCLNVHSPNSTNIWNSIGKITYTYKGTTHTNYTGNYWGDYTGNDADNDGIGDTPYNINPDKDNYPLMAPFKNYLVLTSTTFDTSEGTYPSIMGVHNGTIKPSHDLIVNKMYTYPCVETGGHSERVAFYNSTTGEEIANGTWKGYAVGGYHYIEFDKEFVLHEGITYNYTIKTGSYPQIIHEHVFNTPDGEITCSSFVDANGKVYDDWIPAIRLE